ncbi:MAG: glutamyl-tRNA reductase [Lachnospiraceae bacterium]|nr:glutamyl-tRNA reductase [Lachnospiraceae bacterium]
MKIKMAGIDYQKAPVQVRERFSMTASMVERALRESRQTEGVTGCVIISTCNRTEYWISGEEDAFEGLDAVALLCKEKELEVSDYTEYFTKREGREAVHYLMELSCGLKSQIFGDDQIITQVKRAVDAAREQGALDSVLETLFRTAITGAKKVKSRVLLTNVDRSVASAMGELLEREKIPVSGKRCLVIGNGEIGRLAAAELVRAGGEVFMTLRQYKAKEAVIPAGCRVIDYSGRYEALSQMDLVVSATVSPHYTLSAERTAQYLKDGKKTFIDLAIPRDIEPEIKDMPGVRLFDMDSFDLLKSEGDLRQTALADEILRKYELEYEQWYEFRQYVPVVKKISKLAGEDTAARLKKQLKQYSLKREEQEMVSQAIAQAAARVVAKLCYGLREEMEPQEWGPCLEGLLRSAKELK